jgi:hypothetical protein
MKTVLVLIGFILASIHFAEAQQAKIFKLGLLGLNMRRQASKHFGTGYVIWVTSRARMLSSSISTQGKRWNGFLNLPMS